MAHAPSGRKSTRRPLARFSPLFLEALEERCVPSVVRTLVYNEITSLSRNFGNMNVNLGPRLSASGNRAVFYDAPGPEANRTNDIYVINSDGTGQTLVDSYLQDCFCGAQADISGDGSKVISTEGVQLRIANADGTGRLPLVTDGGGIGIGTIRLSTDGTKVFFVLNSDTTFSVPTQMPAQRGVWVINADGTGLRQVVGPNQLLSQLGLTNPAAAGWGATSADEYLGVSDDGSHLVFAVNITVGTTTAPEIFTVNLDGSGLSQLALNYANVVALRGVGISGNGSEAYYSVTDGPCCSGPSELGVFSVANPSQHTVLVTNAGFPDSQFPSGARNQLTDDGSQLLAGDTGVLINTTTGATLQLAMVCDSFSADAGTLVGNTMLEPTMNSTGTRFLYTSLDANGINQLATLDLNPSGLGNAPSVTNPITNPDFLVNNVGSSTTLSAQVTAPGTVRRVATAFLNNGLDDHTVNAAVLLDNGTGTNTFSASGITTFDASTLGPRTVRFKAESTGSDGRRHATAIDVEPFNIVNQAITSLDRATFTVGLAGPAFTVTTTGTPSLTIPANSLPNGLTFLDNGNGTATINGTPAAGTEGSYAFTISASSGSSVVATQPFILTVNGSPGLNVKIYSSITAGSPTGAPYSGLVDSFSASDIQFGTDTNFNWHPDALSSFGADITGILFVAANGTYTFTLNSDDGSQLLIDNNLVVDRGGNHDPGTTSNSAVLSAGAHPFEVQFYENGINTSGLDLTLPNGVSYSSQAPAITSANQATFAVGTARTFTVAASGSPAPVLTETGALPGGLSFTDNGNGTATIQGTPATGTSGTYAITITAANGVGPNATQSFTLAVRPATPVIPSNLLDVAQAIAHSQEHYINFVTGLYETYLKRAADVGGLNGWVSALFNGRMTDEQVTSDFLISTEYVNNHGGFVLSTSAGPYPGQQWIAGLYNDVLGRAATQAEIQGWIGVMQNTPVQWTPFNVAFSFVGGPEKERQNIIAAYMTYLGRAPLDDEIRAYVNAFQVGSPPGTPFTIEDLRGDFVGSSEYYLRSTKGNGDDATWVRSAYFDILGRAASDHEVNDIWLPILEQQTF
jgi:hypothetical protein